MLIAILWGMALGALLSATFAGSTSGKEYGEENYRLHLRSEGMFIILIFVISIIATILKIVGIS